MRTHSHLRALLLTASLGTALAAQAQNAPAPAATAPTEPAASPGLQPTTVLKLGTMISNRTIIGLGQVLPLPLLVGVERRLNTHWALTGDLTMLGIAGYGVGLSGEGYGLRVLRLGAEAGVRRYYRAGALPVTKAYGGNYVALNARIETLPYGALLYAGTVGLSAQWGVQRRLGCHGLADGFVRLGAETYAGGWHSPQPITRFISPTIEVGLRLSLVR